MITVMITMITLMTVMITIMLTMITLIISYTQDITSSISFPLYAPVGSCCSTAGTINPIVNVCKQVLGLLTLLGLGITATKMFRDGHHWFKTNCAETGYFTISTVELTL